MLKNYRFTDFIRFRNKIGLKYDNTIVQEYLSRIDNDYPANFVDFDLLQDIIEKRHKPADSESINIHMRLGDVIKPKKDGANYNVIQVIKRYGLQQRYSKCNLFLGLWGNTDKTESYKRLNKLSNELRALGLEATIQFKSVDDDFVHLATCSCLIPTIRGFSWLAASMNPNQVYWDIQNPPRFPWLVNKDFLPTLVAGFEYHLKRKKE